MSSIGFLLAPLRDIPAERDKQWMSTVQSWLHIANWTWFNIWKGLPEQQKRGVPKMPPGTGLSSNAMSATRKKDPEIIGSAQPWAERAWQVWNDSERKAPLPVVDAAAAHEALGLDSRMSLPELVGYSGGFKPVPPKKLKRGGSYAFLKNEGDPNAQAFAQEDGTQRALFLEIARGHGGDHLAIWTFGHALHILVARSPSPGARPTLYGPFSVRTRVAAGTNRPGGFVEKVEGALAGSVLRPDFNSLRREIAKPELSVEASFEALGLPGARDFASPDTAAHWNEMDRAGFALLTGQPADKKDVKSLNELLEPLGDSTNLPAKAKLGKGQIARTVANFIVDLKSTLGEPESGPWAERFRAAGFYWDITDGEAGMRLTVGTDRAGMGTSASLARLLAHFPTSLMRDPVFLAMLALECEAANGHAYVEGLSMLAEQTGVAGLVLVVANADQKSALREALGISSDDAKKNDVEGSWCGEALISGTTLTKDDPADAARRFMVKAKATGAIAELSPGKAANLTWYKAGGEVDNANEAGLGPVDHNALSAAAKSFLPREGFIALGAGDILAPGPWHEGSYSGESAPGVEDHRAKKRRHVQKLMSSEVQATPISTMGELLSILGSSLKYQGSLSEQDGGIVSLRVVLPVEDATSVRDLRNDFKGRSLVDRYGEVWADGREVRGYSCSSLDVALLVQVLGDAPAGTMIAVGVGTDVLGAWRIA